VGDGGEGGGDIIRIVSPDMDRKRLIVTSLQILNDSSDLFLFLQKHVTMERCGEPLSAWAERIKLWGANTSRKIWKPHR